MARHNSIIFIHTTQRCLKHWRILALFVMFFCNTSLMVGASAVGNRVDSSTESVESVDVAIARGVSSFSESAAEFIQLPHLFRHQEHYSHRIEQAANDLKRPQLQQQLSGNYSHSSNSSGKNDNKNIHFESQLQPQMSEHLRHHSHRHSLAPVTAWERYILPPLRHQHHQQQDHHHQQTAAATAVVVTSSPSMLLVEPTTTDATVEGVITAATNEQVKIPSSIVFSDNSSSEVRPHKKPHRYFDRDGLYQSPYLWTTKGPKLRVNRNDWTESNFAGIRLENRKQTDSQRISLNLNAGSDAELSARNDNIFKKGKDIASSDKMYTVNSGMIVAENYDSRVIKDGVDSSSEYDDYSYGDSDEDDLTANEFVDVSDSERRVAVKRYTNPFNDLRLPPNKRDYPHPYSATRRRATKDDSKIYANAAADSDNNSDAEFSSEKWLHIEQEHHRKQQEHQRQMLALRARHDSHYRPIEAVSTAAPAILSAAKLQRYSDDEDADNVNSQYYIPGTLTKQKQEELGTLAAVQESRRSHVYKHKQEKVLAGEHVKQILNEAACRVPQRRVERIQRDPSKMYMPHCTVLYRCTDETGCCRSERQTCAPKRTKNVDLYFYVRSINEKRGSVERLTFINHTECHCVEKSRQQVDEYHNLPMYGVSYDGQTIRRATILNCNCPKLYEKILQEDGFCRCDCSSGNTGCDWLKRGMEHFSMIDRKCISEGRCKPPTCEHGPYIKKYGRCPRREEQLSASLTGSAMLATNALSGSDYH